MYKVGEIRKEREKKRLEHMHNMQTYTMCLEHSMLEEVFIQRSKQKIIFLLRRGAESKEYYSESWFKIEFWTPTGPKDKPSKKVGFLATTADDTIRNWHVTSSLCTTSTNKRQQGPILTNFPSICTFVLEAVSTHRYYKKTLQVINSWGFGREPLISILRHPYEPKSSLSTSTHPYMQDCK